MHCQFVLHSVICIYLNTSVIDNQRTERSTLNAAKLLNNISVMFLLFVMYAGVTAWPNL